MKFEIKERLITILAIFAPYLLIAFLVNTLNGRDNLFWLTIGIMVAGRLFFFVMDIISGSIYWRVVRRKKYIEWLVTFFREHEFPSVNPQGEELGSYLFKIIRDSRYSSQLRLDAQELNFNIFERNAIDKFHLTLYAQEALNIYAKSNQAPQA